MEVFSSHLIGDGDFAFDRFVEMIVPLKLSKKRERNAMFQLETELQVKFKG